MSKIKVYVGDLGRNGDRDKIWKAFSQYGTLHEVWVARNPPGFAFVEFEDPRDAEDAVAEMDGKCLCGQAVKVEISHRQSRGSGGRGGGGGGGGDRGYRGRRSDDRGYRREDRFEQSRYSPPPRRRSRSPPRGGRNRSPAAHYSRRSRSRSPVPRQ